MGEERVVVSRRREGRGRSPSPSAPSSAVSFALQLGVQPLCLVSLGRRGNPVSGRRERGSREVAPRSSAVHSVHPPPWFSLHW